MKIYKTQAAVERDVVNGVLIVKESVKFAFHLQIEANLRIAGNILAGNILAGDISAGDISAGNISARDISFYAVCFAYVEFVCKSIRGNRKNSKYFCLDSKVKIEKEGK